MSSLGFTSIIGSGSGKTDFLNIIRENLTVERITKVKKAPPIKATKIEELIRKTKYIDETIDKILNVKKQANTNLYLFFS